MATHPGRDVRMNQIADWMAEHGGSLYQCSKALALPYDRVKHSWARIRKRLGPQAC